MISAETGDSGVEGQRAGGKEEGPSEALSSPAPDSWLLPSSGVAFRWITKSFDCWARELENQI